MLKSVLVCDRCSDTKDINGQINPSVLQASNETGYLMVLGSVLCKDCTAAVTEFIRKRVQNVKRDSGFTDGRPVAQAK